MTTPIFPVNLSSVFLHTKWAILFYLSNCDNFEHNVAGSDILRIKCRADWNKTWCINLPIARTLVFWKLLLVYYADLYISNSVWQKSTFHSFGFTLAIILFFMCCYYSICLRLFIQNQTLQLDPKKKKTNHGIFNEKRNAQVIPPKPI